MHNLEASRAFGNAAAAEAMIFNAARANSARDAVQAGAYRVTFEPLLRGDFKAVVTDAAGACVATAVVDEFDC